MRLFGEIAGCDGCAAGWVCVVQGESGALSVNTFPDCASLCDEIQAEVIAIDIPIGMTSKGSRICDVKARALLEIRRSSVFPAPRRPHLVATNYEQACQLGLETDGKKYSKQAFALFPKVKEVDLVVLRPEHRLREVHPELSFCEMNCGEPLAYSKRTQLGQGERRNLLSSAFGVTVIENLALQAGVGRDDLYDALAALWTARRIQAGNAKKVPPGEIPQDECGIEMAIWY